MSLDQALKGIRALLSPVSRLAKALGSEGSAVDHTYVPGGSIAPLVHAVHSHLRRLRHRIVALVPADGTHAPSGASARQPQHAAEIAALLLEAVSRCLARHINHGAARDGVRFWLLPVARLVRSVRPLIHAVWDRVRYLLTSQMLALNAHHTAAIALVITGLCCTLSEQSDGSAATGGAHAPAVAPVCSSQLAELVGDVIASARTVVALQAVCVFCTELLAALRCVSNNLCIVAPHCDTPRGVTGSVVVLPSAFVQACHWVSARLPCAVSLPSGVRVADAVAGDAERLRALLVHPELERAWAALGLPPWLQCGSLATLLSRELAYGGATGSSSAAGDDDAAPLVAAADLSPQLRHSSQWYIRSVVNDVTAKRDAQRPIPTDCLGCEALVHVARYWESTLQRESPTHSQSSLVGMSQPPASQPDTVASAWAIPFASTLLASHSTRVLAAAVQASLTASSGGSCRGGGTAAAVSDESGAQCHACRRLARFANSVASALHVPATRLGLACRIAAVCAVGQARSMEGGLGYAGACRVASCGGRQAVVTAFASVLHAAATTRVMWPPMVTAALVDGWLRPAIACRPAVPAASTLDVCRGFADVLVRHVTSLWPRTGTDRCGAHLAWLRSVLPGAVLARLHSLHGVLAVPATGVVPDNTAAGTCGDGLLGDCFLPEATATAIVAAISSCHPHDPTTAGAGTTSGDANTAQVKVTAFGGVTATPAHVSTARRLFAAATVGMGPRHDDAVGELCVHLLCRCLAAACAELLPAPPSLAVSHLAQPAGQRLSLPSAAALAVVVFEAQPDAMHLLWPHSADIGLPASKFGAAAAMALATSIPLPQWERVIGAGATPRGSWLCPLLEHLRLLHGGEAVDAVPDALVVPSAPRGECAGLQGGAEAMASPVYISPTALRTAQALVQSLAARAPDRIACRCVPGAPSGCAGLVSVALRLVDELRELGVASRVLSCVSALVRHWRASCESSQAVGVVK